MFQIVLQLLAFQNALLLLLLLLHNVHYRAPLREITSVLREIIKFLQLSHRSTRASACGSFVLLLFTRTRLIDILRQTQTGEGTSVRATPKLRRGRNRISDDTEPGINAPMSDKTITWSTAYSLPLAARKRGSEIAEIQLHSIMGRSTPRGTSNDHLTVFLIHH